MRLLPTIILAFSLAGCFIPGMVPTATSHREAKERSLRDSAVVISMDTAFYLARPVYLASVGFNVSGNPIITISTMERSPLARFSATRPVNDDTVIFIIRLLPVDKHVSIRLPKNPTAPAKFIHESHLFDGPRVDPHILTTLLASGVLNHEPEADSMVARQERERSVVAGSVSVRNRCGRTVLLFSGDDPSFGSGQLLTIGGNSIGTVGAIRRGRKLWLVDDDRRTLGSVFITERTREVEIGSDGKSITVYD